MTTFTCAVERDVDKQKPPTENTRTFVIGRWTHHAYKMSHKGGTNIIHQEDGIKVVQGDKSYEFKLDLKAHNPREFIFHPDDKMVAFWAPLLPPHLKKRVAVMKLSGLTDNEPKYDIVYTPEVGHLPFGMEWSPGGKALYVIEKAREDKLLYTILYRIEMSGTRKPKEIARRQGTIDFFMPPVSRFENGGGTKETPYHLIFGAEDGLYLVDPKGKKQERLSKLPAVGLHNIEWNPQLKPKAVNQVILYFRYPSVGPDGRKFKGVYLVDIDKWRADRSRPEEEFIENLYDQTDIHTLWYSPKGTYMTWSSKKAIYYRKPAEDADKTVKIEVLDEEEEAIDIRGVSWNHDEDRLVFTCQGRVMVYETKEEDPKKRMYAIATFEKGFAAEPRWLSNGKVFYTVVNNAKQELKELRNTPDIDMGYKFIDAPESELHPEDDPTEKAPGDAGKTAPKGGDKKD